MTEIPAGKQNIDSIKWTTWLPQQRATLLFVVRDGHILLIEKKRGLGAGKVITACGWMTRTGCP